MASWDDFEIDQSGSDMVLRFTSPSLCERCKTLSIRFDRPRYAAWYFGYKQQDSFGAFPQLERLAHAGCEFCGFLRLCLLSEIDDRNHPYPPELLSSTDVAVHIEINDIVLYNVGADHSKGRLLNGYFEIVASIHRAYQRTCSFRFDCQIHKRTFHFIPGDGLTHNLKAYSLAAPTELPNRDPVSDDNVKMIMSWLHECDSSHHICNSNREPFSPTRLIRIGQSDSIRLELCQGQSAEYVALSYCWGKQVMDARTMTTNLKDRLAGFQSTELPQTLQDAIHVVRKLSIQYIWVDMVCIVQDDTNDWEREAQNMSSVYQNAYLTLCPTAAWSASDSFLWRPDCHSLEIPFTIEKPGTLEQKGIFYARYPWSGYTSALISNSKWKRRGWTLQEQILSTRILYFTGDVTFFECSTLQKVEDIEYGFQKPLSTPWLPEKKAENEGYPAALSILGAQQAHNKPYRDWYSIVEEYSSRQLTCVGDKLPALSGLAHKFAQAMNDNYLAGLWKGDLWRGIMWEPRFRDDMKQSPQYRAPSWSWAALDGAVAWSPSFTPDPSFEIRSAEIMPSGVDTMGLVRGGRIVASGKLLPVEEFVKHPSQWKKGVCYNNSGVREAYGEVHCDMTSELSLDSRLMAVAIIYTGQFSRGLLLQSMYDEQSNEVYCRLGLYCCHSDRFLQVKPSVITII